MKREELIKSREYWITKIQLSLFSAIEEYRISKNYTKTQLAEELGFTKGYITQVLNGDFDHKISKLVDLALACGKAPEISFSSIKEMISSTPSYSEVITTYSAILSNESNEIGLVKYQPLKMVA
jgi:transcriptional regulator with XRE-family HTH domain